MQHTMHQKISSSGPEQRPNKWSKNSSTTNYVNEITKKPNQNQLHCPSHI